MTMAAIDTSSTTEDDRYDSFLSLIQTTFDAALAKGKHLFTTNATGLMDVYLNASPPGERQFRTCHCCRQFLYRFGGLVTIDESGHQHPVMWNIAKTPPMYRDAAVAISAAVERAEVTGVFLSSDKTWGTPQTGKWTHFAVRPPKDILWKSAIQNPSQRMAEKHEECGMLLRGLAEFDIDTVRHAHALLTNGSLYRSEKCVGVAAWLLDLHERRTVKNKQLRENLTWLAVASAPAGFCHVKSGMIGTLLEDLAAKMDVATVKRRFDEKMNPLQYQRPQAAPSAGNIAQAEKIVGALKSAGALERRFAKLSDVEKLWTPAPKADEPKGDGVFGHLKKSTKPSIIDTGAAPVVMTWSKFAKTVLPTAEAITFNVPHGFSAFCAMVTATNPDAPPILQWDREERRNPVSWYVYNGGSAPENWNMKAGSTVDVTAIVLQPTMWDPTRSYANHGEGLMLVLRGAYDKKAAGCGLALFPETLKSEYHAIRATIEAHSKSGVISGQTEAEVCGLVVRSGGKWSVDIIVTSRGVRTAYRLDRWD